MCPFCYLGDTNLAHALERFDERDRVDIRFRSFQLHPELPEDGAVDIDEFLATKLGASREQAAAMNAGVADRGRAAGLDFHFERALAANTRRAHELSHFAAEHGRQHALMTRLFEAQFVDGLDVSDPDVLVDIAADVGLDPQAARGALDDAVYAAAVDADIDEARRLGVSGVPFFVFDHKYAVSGAQPVETFLAVLTELDERPD